MLMDLALVEGGIKKEGKKQYRGRKREKRRARKTAKRRATVVEMDVFTLYPLFF